MIASQRQLNLQRLAAVPKALSSETLRVTSVSYLNSVVYDSLAQFDQGNEVFNFERCEPAECARRLHEGETDLALVPLVEFAQHGGYTFLPYGIAANGPVDSVLVLSSVPFDRLRTIHVDQASRTSVVLLRLLLDRLQREGKLGAEEVRLVRRDPDAVLDTLAAGEGILVIGNQALTLRGRFQFETDLSDLWKQHTGKAFVFAVWAARNSLLSKERLESLVRCFEQGIGEREVRARAWAEQFGVDRDLASNYLNNRIIYKLDEAELAGAAQFLSEAADLGFVPRLPRPLAELMTTGVQTNLGAPADTTRLPTRAVVGRSLDSILADAAGGIRLSLSEGLRLAGEASIAELALASDERRRALHPDNDVSFIIDRNINYTNICNVYCRFCAFYSAPGKAGGYLLSKEELAEKIEELLAAGGQQILLQGGLNPELGIDYYEELFHWIKESYPINLHALSADEIWHITRVSNLSVEETLRRLIAAGLGSLPGGGAEILVDRVRRRIARLKTTSSEWLEAHRVAHRLGITSTCTMMFGVQESWEDRMLHLLKLRSLQDETGGFTAFITWSFQDENTNLAKGDTSSTEYLRVQAVSRLFLDNIANLQSSWVTQGPSVGQVGLYFGANDFGSVMLEENVVSAAGTIFQMDQALIERHIREAGFKPWQRDVHYQAITPLSSPIEPS